MMPQGALDGVRLSLITSLAELDACRRWAGERRETPLFADTESGGLNPYRHRHRMTQLGDMRRGWAFPPAWAGAAVELLMTYRGQVGFHNSPYDWRVLAVHQGVTPLWHKTEDTLLLGHIADSLRLAGLKERSAHEVDRALLQPGQPQRVGDVPEQQRVLGLVPCRGDTLVHGQHPPVVRAVVEADLAPVGHQQLDGGTRPRWREGPAPAHVAELGHPVPVTVRIQTATLRIRKERRLPPLTGPPTAGVQLSQARYQRSE